MSCFTRGMKLPSSCFYGIVFSALIGAVPSALAAPTQVEKFVAAARQQAGITTHYDPRYVQITYPGGDVPLQTGVCSDVVIRAMRAIGTDLQQKVHEDMVRNFSAYPQKWRMKQPDASIDHRRVPNLMAYFSRMGKSLPIQTQAKDFKAGDIVAWALNSRQTHIGIVSDETTLFGQRHLIFHNIGRGVQHEDVLFNWKIIGHYRL
jgi:uncharacterized protein